MVKKFELKVTKGVNVEVDGDKIVFTYDTTKNPIPGGKSFPLFDFTDATDNKWLQISENGNASLKWIK